GRGDGGTSHGVGGTPADRRGRGSVRAVARRPPAAGGPGGMVLPSETRLAGRFDVRLPALGCAGGGGGMGRLPGGSAGRDGGALGGPPAEPGSPGRVALFRGIAVSRTGILQRLSLSLFLRRGPFPIPGEPRTNRPRRRRLGRAAAPRRAAGAHRRRWPGRTRPDRVCRAGPPAEPFLP